MEEYWRRQREEEDAYVQEVMEQQREAEDMDWVWDVLMQHFPNHREEWYERRERTGIGQEEEEEEEGEEEEEEEVGVPCPLPRLDTEDEELFLP